MVEPEQPESVTAGLIAELEAGGEAVDEGRFTLDPSKARLKLREHRLADPRFYVCLLVEVGVLLAAERIDLWSAGEELRVELRGVGFEPAELANVLGALWSEGEAEDRQARRRKRALQQLAIAVDGALADGAAEIEIESWPEWGGGGRFRAWIDDGEDRFGFEELAYDPEAQAGLEIRVRHAPKLGDFLRTPLTRIVEERCRLSRHPIRVAGRPAAKGPRAELGRGLDTALVFAAADAGETVVEGEHLGEASFDARSDEPARLIVLINGSYSETLSPPELPAGLVAVVEADLRRDLSQKTAVRGPEFTAIVEAVADAAARLRAQAPRSKALQRRSEQRPSTDAESRPMALGTSFAAVGLPWLAIVYLLHDLSMLLAGLVLVAGVVAVPVIVGHLTRPSRS